MSLRRWIPAEWKTVSVISRGAFSREDVRRTPHVWKGAAHLPIGCRNLKI
jgi:hypothetical protein